MVTSSIHQFSNCPFPVNGLGWMLGHPAGKERRILRNLYLCGKRRLWSRSTRGKPVRAFQTLWQQTHQQPVGQSTEIKVNPIIMEFWWNVNRMWLKQSGTVDFLTTESKGEARIEQLRSQSGIMWHASTSAKCDSEIQNWSETSVGHFRHCFGQLVGGSCVVKLENWK